jgi:hypothetical protein
MCYSRGVYPAKINLSFSRTYNFTTGWGGSNIYLFQPYLGWLVEMTILFDGLKHVRTINQKHTYYDSCGRPLGQAFGRPFGKGSDEFMT